MTIIHFCVAVNKIVIKVSYSLIFYLADFIKVIKNNNLNCEIKNHDETHVSTKWCCEKNSKTPPPPSGRF